MSAAVEARNAAIFRSNDAGASLVLAVNVALSESPLVTSASIAVPSLKTAVIVAV